MCEARDGFLTTTRKRIEAAVMSNGHPGIMVAHSMGNVMFRYFLEWLRVQLREEAYVRYVKAQKRATNTNTAAEPVAAKTETAATPPAPGWVSSILPRSTYVDSLMGVQVDEDENNAGIAANIFDTIDELWRSLYWTDDTVAANDDATVAFSADGGGDSEGEGEGEDSGSGTKAPGTIDEDDDDANEKLLRELAEIEGDEAWREWVDDHIWTYVGLSAPLLGATGPLRSVISGENMGLPMDDLTARDIELSFGSTNTVNNISTNSGFWGDDDLAKNRAKLASLHRIVEDVEEYGGTAAWDNHPVLRLFLRDKVDWDVDHPLIRIVVEHCRKGQSANAAAGAATPAAVACDIVKDLAIEPKMIQNGTIFTEFAKVWNEKGAPLLVKKDQLEDSFWHTDFPNILNHTWDRPPIKHVIMSYGVDIPTENGYVYAKKVFGDAASQSPKYDTVPSLRSVIREQAGGELIEESMIYDRNFTITDKLLKRNKPTRSVYKRANETVLPHSGDGTVPYISLAWAHTWLLHSARAIAHDNVQGEYRNPLMGVEVSHRPKGGNRWKDGFPAGMCGTAVEEQTTCEAPDEGTSTGTSHPHGTRYKPEMIRYRSDGVSRTTGMEYTTSVIEAIGVEHKETTRNYDILAAVFTDVLKFMHDDLDLI
mmetsp:Transcript_10280/g.22822  ORF Transcript_10280/g.22822 Transcript_10280/m.22822 type:complete len:652 (-) Transcript_10280:492-2447(-)